MHTSIFHIPHSSVLIPTDVRPVIRLNDTELNREILAMTDHFTSDLFGSGQQPEDVIEFPISRLIVDPERFVDDELESMSRVGMGVIYTKTSQGKLLRKAPTPAERDSLIETFYNPHHQKLTDRVAEHLTNNGNCLILDCHSFPKNPLPYESDQSPKRPEICLGTDAFHTPEPLAQHAFEAFKSAGFSVSFNSPFAGALVPMQYFRKRTAVSALMIELRRDLYMNEKTGEKIPGYQSFKNRLDACIEEITSCNLRG